MADTQKIRTRFAPSPTGYVHIGNVRTALFNYLFARNQGGEFILRVEDTDKKRSKSEFETNIYDGLRWLGMQWNEGPDCGGPMGPYRQSERTDIYKKYLIELDKKGLLYKCYCTEEELEKERELQVLGKQPPRYSGKCSALSDAERKTHEDTGRSSTLRFRIPKKIVRVVDLVRGEMEFDTSILDDCIIAKDFDNVLYNFAVVVDDALMEITHVLRGEEHLSNVPKQVLIAEALGFSVPQFAHLSLILNADRAKLSKRENKTSLIEYQSDGYLPEAIVNFISLLGWNPGGDRELFSIAELEKEFDLSGLHKAGAIFNVQKLDWFNGHYTRKKDIAELTELCLPYLINAGHIEYLEHNQYTIKKTGEPISFYGIQSIIALEQERMKKLSDCAESTAYLFIDHLVYDPAILAWKNMELNEVAKNLHDALTQLDTISDNDFVPAHIEAVLKEAITAKEKKNGEVLWPLRVALTGLQASPSPFDVAALLGKKKTLRRLSDAIALLPAS